ncbi:MAG: ABC transporter ATP-binding protein [Burkholderiales bacterium]|nr:ABC transporter ATP-binding protein [Burkholderiales bacterium]
MDNVSALDVKDLGKIYSNTDDGIAGGLRKATFALQPGTFFTLLGPSGCGKTTTLRCIAGLEKPDRGLIRLAGDVMFDAGRGVNTPLNRRRMGMVFQSYAIWPHMSVFENVAFPLRVASDRKFTGSEITRMVDEALRRVGLEGFQARSATRLSGGQQQRVALARAIVREPRLLLLDEPLSNLDAALRDEMRNELKRLQLQVGITTIYVTHDQSEALEMSDLVAVMNHGDIVQMGPPREIYFRPRNAFVAGFVGATNLVYGAVAGAADARGVAPVALAGGHAVSCLFHDKAAARGEVAISVRPEAIALVPTDAPRSDGLNRLNGKVILGGFLGNMMRYSIKVGDAAWRVNTNPNVTFANGADVALEFSADSAIGVRREDPSPAAPAQRAAGLAV